MDLYGPVSIVLASVMAVVAMHVLWLIGKYGCGTTSDDRGRAIIFALLVLALSIAAVFSAVGNFLPTYPEWAGAVRIAISATRCIAVILGLALLWDLRHDR